MSSKSSTTEDSLTDPVVVGRIRKPHGIRGEVAVEALSGDIGRFPVGAVFELAVPRVTARSVRVVSSRHHQGATLVRFEGIETRNQSEELRGGTLAVPRSAVPPAGEDEYYFFDLVGCGCFDRGKSIGVVSDVVEDGGGELLVLEGDAGSLLVPFVKAYLREVDIDGRRIDVQLPEGLIETCVFRS